VPEKSVETLQAEAQHEGARRLVEEGDRVQWQDARWRAELAFWIRPAGCREGLGVPTMVAPFARFAVKRFDMGRCVGAHDRQLA